MDYLKTLFPVVNTLPDHLRRFTSLTEDEIIESTKHFTHVVVVCDKNEPNFPFTGGCGPCSMPFKELLEFAQRTRQKSSQIFTFKSLEIRAWFHFHTTVGDVLLRYFFEKCYLFRALKDKQNFLVQIVGVPVFPNAVPSGIVSNAISGIVPAQNGRKKNGNGRLIKNDGGIRRDELTEIRLKIQPQKRTSVDIAIGEGPIKRKKHRRGKRKKRKTTQEDALPPAPLSPTHPLLTLPNSRRHQEPRGPKEMASKAARISLRPILYCGDLRERFVGRHPIADAAAESNRELDQHLFQRTFGSMETHPNYHEMASSMTQLHSIFRQWINRHRRCKCYTPYLDIFCPTDDSILETTTLPNLLQYSCQIAGVKRVLEAVFNRLIPADLFGESNGHRLVNAVIQFVVNGRRYDSTSVHQLANCVKSSQCPWLRQIRTPELRQHLVVRLLNLVIRYLLRVVSSCFYVTDSQSDKYQLFFFRKRTWLQIVRRASDQFREQCRLVPVDQPLQSFFGPFALRWIPKSGGGVRPIVCGQFGQRRCGTARMSSVTAMNNQLKQTLAIAQYLVRKSNIPLMGHTTADFNDIHVQWKNYVLKQRGIQKDCSLPRYFIVKADVSGCFDSIDQKKLWSLVKDKLIVNAPDSFFLQAHWMIRSSSSLASSSSGISRKIRYAVSPAGEYESLARHYLRLMKDGKSGCPGNRKNSVVVPKGAPIAVSKTTFINDIERLIFRRVLTLNGKRGRYLQTIGISQGSSLSVLLCNLYLADLERTHLDTLIRENDLMLRHIDDLVYVTPSLEKAKGFAELISAGFPDFNCSFKVDKLASNFQWDISLCDEMALIIPQTRNVTSLVPWCGLLFECSSLDLFIDHHRWSGKDARDWIVVDFSKYPPSYVVQKLLFYLRTRAPNAPFDAAINATKSVGENAIFLVRYLAACYKAYVQAYEENDLVDERAKEKLRGKKYVKELARRIHVAVRGRIRGNNTGHDILGLGTVMKIFLGNAGK